MYIELDNLLSGCTTADSWYDDGCIIAGDILTEFKTKDWEELLSIVLTKSLDWQKKLAYCLDSSCNSYELTILLLLLNTEDQELFEICIDTLRSFDILELKRIVIDNPLILKRIDEMLIKASSPVRKILEDFLLKIS
ncbi:MULTISPECIES: hypothetical protein [Lysinibacillus]|uniref:Uncharacterized protein n=1 Tax=Lysinibacillus xylanilyticus TaxID=582475 RepID=A0ABV3VXZ6_9BACI